jgi:hypothetical protein
LEIINFLMAEEHILAATTDSVPLAYTLVRAPPNWSATGRWGGGRASSRAPCSFSWRQGRARLDTLSD